MPPKEKVGSCFSHKTGCVTMVKVCTCDAGEFTPAHNHKTKKLCSECLTEYTIQTRRVDKAKNMTDIKSKEIERIGRHLHGQGFKDLFRTPDKEIKTLLAIAQRPMPPAVRSAIASRYGCDVLCIISNLHFFLCK